MERAKREEERVNRIGHRERKYVRGWGGKGKGGESVNRLGRGVDRRKKGEGVEMAIERGS